MKDACASQELYDGITVNHFAQVLEGRTQRVTILMRVISLFGHTFDLDQIASSRVENTVVVLTFRNTDCIHLSWRDSSERTALHKTLELSEGTPEKPK